MRELGSYLEISVWLEQGSYWNILHQQREPLWSLFLSTTCRYCERCYDRRGVVLTVKGTQCT